MLRYDFILTSFFILLASCSARAKHAGTASRAPAAGHTHLHAKETQDSPYKTTGMAHLGILPIHIDVESDTVFVLLGNESPPAPWSDCSEKSKVGTECIIDDALENGARQLNAYFQEEHFRGYTFKSKTSALKHSIAYLKTLPCYGPFFQKKNTENKDALLLVEVPPVAGSEVAEGPYQNKSSKQRFRWFDFESLLESTKKHAFTKECGLRYSLAPHFVQLMRSNYDSLSTLVKALKKKKELSTNISLAKCLRYLEESLQPSTLSATPDSLLVQS